MRTKFDKFDNSECDVYWEVTTLRPYFDIICWKLGVPDGRYDNILNEPKEMKRFNVKNFFYVKKFCANKYNNGWQWDATKLSAMSCNTELKFMGTLHMFDVSEEDIENWELHQNEKKYNL